MQSPPKHPLIAVTQEEMEQVRQDLNIDRIKIIKNLNAIMGWIQKEEHLAEASKYLDSNCLERLHIIEKGSVERTKSRIDKLLTTRGMVPEICLDKTIDEFDEFSKHVIYVPLPKLNPADLTRVNVIQLVSEKGNDTILLNFIRYVFLVIDYCMGIDYNLGERYILDLKHFNMTGLAKMNPFTLRKGEVVCMDGYGLRIKGIHIVNAPSFVNKLITLLKTTLSEKIFKRIHVHTTLDDLREEISKEILPEEYGGDLDSASIIYVERMHSLIHVHKIQTIDYKHRTFGFYCYKFGEFQENGKWNSTLRTTESRKLTETANKLFSDESKRSSYKFNTEYMGLPGSFHRLVVD